MDKSIAVEALFKAEMLLDRYCAPDLSTDAETLGLSGAINKRLFEWTGELRFLERAIAFYERGFYVAQDYYNGINVAFMYTLRANLLEDDFSAIVSYGHGNLIRGKVVDICKKLIDDGDAFSNRGDQEWVYTTLAEAHQGLRDEFEEMRLRATVNEVASDFAKDSYETQRAKLAKAMDAFEARIPQGGTTPK